MRFLRLLIALPTAALALGFAAAAATATHTSILDQLAGRYERPFANSMADGEGYASIDVLEVLPLGSSRSRAFLNLQLNFRNGHSCEVVGPVRVHGATLLYSEPNSDRQERACSLSLWREGDLVRWADHGTCFSHCGMRGSLQSGGMPYSLRRAVTATQARRRVSVLRDR